MPPKVACGNPLFLSWMEELRDEARSKNMKSGETYGKACKSLAACPIPYARPRELVCLQGIGPKIVTILEKRWKEYCAANDLPIPGTPQKKKGKERASPSPSLKPGGDENAATSQPPAKKRKPAKPKAYVPQKGSGGYGILMALILAIDNPAQTTQVFLTKGEVIRAGQPYCESSYDRSSQGTHFTAWGSMKTLIGKGYVYVTGNPHKYCLTEEGHEVAVIIRNMVPELARTTPSPQTTEAMAGPSKKAAPNVPKMSEPMGSVSPQKAGGTRPRRSFDKFEFWYIDPLGNRVHEMGSALARLDPEDFVNIRKIEFLYDQKDHAFTAQLKLVDSTPQDNDGSQSTLFAYILEEHAPPRCSTFASAENPGATVTFPSPSKPTIFEEDDDFISMDYTGGPTPTRPKDTTFARTVSAPAQPLPVQGLPSKSASSFDRCASQPIQPLGVHGSLGLESKRLPHSGPRLSSHMPAPTPLRELGQSPISSNVPPFNPADVTVWPAGSFEVILILDTREVESRKHRDNFAENLLQKGIKMEQRALRLADMCWIARKLDGLGGEEDECVLDYVAERKRLDDLCGSIKDGRYTEQCFRLGNSAISNVFYIVEDYELAERMAYDGLQIMTAKSQLQVHNSFILKETHRLSETIDFLAMMTNVITSLHSRQDLYVLPTRLISRASYTTLQASLRQRYPDKRYLTSFQAYQDLNDKTASRTLREQLGRMLLCVKGISAERVSALLDEFETPRDLWIALKERQQFGVVEEVDDKGKKRKRAPESFFAERIQGEGRRKIGEALSGAVGLLVHGMIGADWQLWKGLMGGGGSDEA